MEILFKNKTQLIHSDCPSVIASAQLVSMDEYSSEKSATEACGFGDPIETLKFFFEEQRSRARICVEGYDTSLPAVDIARALHKYFSPCGYLCNLVIRTDPVTNVVVDRCSYFELCGEGAAEKALALNGTDVGGWNVAVKVLPHKNSEFTTDQLAAMSDAHFRKTRSFGVSVTGYDPSLPANDVKSTLRKHFASCGEITDVFVFNRRAFVYIFGGTRDAVALSGSKMGGWELVVKAMPKPKRNFRPTPGDLPFGYTIPADAVKNAHRKFMAEKMADRS